MLIVCPSCGTSYDVEPASLQPAGRKVRCVRCRTVWGAKPPHEDLLVAAAQALAPAGEPASGAAKSDDAPPVQPSQVEAAEYRGSELAEFGAADDSAEPGRLAAAETPPTAPIDLDSGPRPRDIDLDAGDERPDNASAELAWPHEDIETYAARMARRRRWRWRWPWPMSRLQSAALALAIIDAALVGGRVQVVRAMPQTARFYALAGLPVNLRGLVFQGVSIRKEQRAGAPILVVQGTIANDVGVTVAVPRLKLALRNAARQTVYSWTAPAPRATLTPGQSVAFRTQLASPPSAGRDVVVRFVTRRDLLADGH